MSTSTEGAFTFQWDLSDRLAKTLRATGLSTQEMAEHLEVHRNTIGSWLRGHTAPSAPALRVWAMRVGASYEWLRYGIEPNDDNGPDGPGGLPEPSGPSLLLPRLDSNQKPADGVQQTDKAAA